MAKSAQPVGPVMAALSTYMSEARDRALPADVVEKTKHHVLDTFAAMISGAELAPGRAAIRFARGYGGAPVATVAGSDVLCGPIEAALANGMLAHADETDDSHAPSLSHPGCAVVPAALAVGEQFGIDGTHFLRAVALGYDIGPRVTMCARRSGAFARGAQEQPQHRRRVRRGGGGRLRGRPRRPADALAHRLHGAAVLRHRRLAARHATISRRRSCSAACRRAAGSRPRCWSAPAGPASTTSCRAPDNFFLAFRAQRRSGAARSRSSASATRSSRTNIKKWSVGSPIQAPLDALESSAASDGHSMPTQVQKVVRARGDPRSLDREQSRIPDICLQHMVAVMLIDKTVSFQAAHDVARMQDPAVLRQRAKVELVPDEELERRPAARGDRRVSR